MRTPSPDARRLVSATAGGKRDSVPDACTGDIISAENTMAFPITRPRRLRRTETIRRMVRETRLSPDDLILPMFVCAGRGVKKPVASMPGVAQMSVDNIVAEARETWSAGVPAVI